MDTEGGIESACVDGVSVLFKCVEFKENVRAGGPPCVRDFFLYGQSNCP